MEACAGQCGTRHAQYPAGCANVRSRTTPSDHRGPLRWPSIETQRIAGNRRTIPFASDRRSAAVIGASFEGQPIGSGSNLTAFSPYATKNLTTGEGGMLTGDADLLDHARVISLHGMNREAWSRYSAGGKWSYDIVDTSSTT